MLKRPLPRPDKLRRPALVFNIFRLFMAAALIPVTFFSEQPLLGDATALPVGLALTGYLLISLLYFLGLRIRRPAFDVMVSTQAVIDVLFVVALMHLAGGFRSGIGILLLPYLAASGLLSRGRATLFHAAVATLALLLQQALQFHATGSMTDLVQVALLAIACFAVAWLSYQLAQFATESQKLAEQRGEDLANLAQINRMIIQDVSDGVLVVDGQGLVRQYNLRAERMLGQGLSAGKTRLEQLSAQLAAAAAQWRAGSTVFGQIDIPATQRTVRPRFMPIRTGQQASGLVVFLEDTERLRQEAQQLKLAALGRLTANIAHEIRNPLGAIGHAAQLLAEEVESASQQRLVRIIEDNTRRLDRMVRAVLDLNRRDRAQPVEIRLHDWLSHFADEFAEVEAAGTVIDVDSPLGAVVRFDEGQLHQVLWNLCRNGWRYCSKQPGSLRLNVVHLGERWALEVRDDGPGVPPDRVGQLFEPFSTTDTKGTGLGLYIAREICAGNDSVLEYVPMALGACFRLTFPAKT